MHRNGTGVLNDFDLARLITSDILYPRGFDRTGTKPFLALDLLTDGAQDGKVERLYRHDLESFLWVLMWIAACYDSGVESIPDYYRRWLHEDTALCRGTKRDMLHYETLNQTTTQSFRFLGPVIVILRKYWRSFYNQRQEIIQQHALKRLVKRSVLDASPSTHIVPIEPSDEQVLLNLLDTFTSDPTIADYLESNSLMDDIPFTLFRT